MAALPLRLCSAGSGTCLSCLQLNHCEAGGGISPNCGPALAWSKWQEMYLSLIAVVEVIEHFLKIPHEHLILSRWAFQKPQQLYPERIVEWRMLSLKELHIDELTIECQYFRADIRQFMASIMAIAVLRHDDRIINQLPDQLLLVAVDAA